MRKCKKLNDLYLYRNQLSGSVSFLNELPITNLNLKENPNLTGGLTKKSDKFWIGKTKIVICGAGKTFMPVGLVKNNSVSLSCMKSTSYALSKRAALTVPTSASSIGLSCTYDSNGYIYQDCFFVASYLCLKNEYSNGFDAAKCVNYYKSIAATEGIHSYFRNYFKYCSSYSSSQCKIAKADLKRISYWVPFEDGNKQVAIDDIMISSVDQVFNLGCPST